MNLENEVEQILKAIGNPSEGLPDEVFRLVVSITPMVNVDLLIRDDKNRILLARREDKFSGSVWHIPGGIVRFKETLQQRIEQVALLEIGQPVVTNGVPVAINEIRVAHQERGHFISFLYECKLSKELVLNEKVMWKHGDLKWFEYCPEDFIPCQKEIYEVYFS